MTLGAPIELSVLDFAESAGSYTLLGGTIRLTPAYSIVTLNTGLANVSPNTAFIETGTGNHTISSAIIGPVGFIKNGGGTLILTGENTYGGTTTVGDGTLQIGNGGNTGSIASDIRLYRTSSTLVFDRSDSFTHAGTIFDLGGVVKKGPGIVTLSGLNTYVGATRVEAGTLQIARSISLGGSLIVSSGATAAFNVGGNGEFTMSGVAALSGFQAGSALGVDTTNATGAVTYTGSLIGANSVGFTKLGSGTLILSGTGGLTGLTTVSAGTLQFEKSSSINGGAPLTPQKLRVESGATAVFNVGVPANGEFTNNSFAQISTLGTATGGFLSGSTIGINVTNALTNVSLSAITNPNGGLNSLGFLKIGAGTVTLTGNSTYSGPTKIEGGTLQIGAGVTSGSISSNSVVNNGTLIYERFSGTDTYAGIISGTGNVIKTGGGNITLSGANTYTGATTVTSGTLTLGNALALQNSTLNMTGGALSFGTLDAATLGGVSSTYAIALTNSSGAAVTLTLGNNNSTQNYSAILSGSGSLIKAGNGTLTLSGANTFTGTTTPNAGTLTLANSLALQNSTLNTSTGTLSFGALTAATLGGLGGAGPLALTNASSGAVALTVGNNNTSSTYSGSLDGSGSLTKTGSGALSLAGNSSYAGGTTISAGTLQIGNGATTGSVIGNIIISGGATLSLNRSDSIVFPNALSGTGSVSKLGSNTLTLTGDSSHTGTFTINGGHLQVGNGGTTGSLSSSLNLVTGATLRFSRSDASSFTSVISGAGSLVKDTSETLTLSGANTFSGGTTLSAGTLAAGSNSALGTGALTLNGGALQAAPGGGTLANAVNLTADSTINGSRALTLNGTVTLSGFKALNVTNTATTTLAGNITESAPSILIKQGAGELQLTGANTYTGGTFIQAGTVRINNSTGSAFGTGAVTVASGATLAGAGSFTGALQLNGTYSPGNSPGTSNTGSQTWAGGGAYVWEINNATGVSGTNYDLLNITGSLNITATNASPFAINLTSLTTGNAAGNVINFNSAANYSYTIATASGGISGFGADKFTLNTSSFSNALDGGTWSLAQSGNHLNLNFTASAIPEPSTYAALAGLAALALAVHLRRRRPSP